MLWNICEKYVVKPNGTFFWVSSENRVRFSASFRFLAFPFLVLVDDFDADVFVRNALRIQIRPYPIFLAPITFILPQFNWRAQISHRPLVTLYLTFHVDIFGELNWHNLITSVVYSVTLLRYIQISSPRFTFEGGGWMWTTCTCCVRGW